MARKTWDQFISEMAALFPDNTSQEISPEDLRTVFASMVNDVHRLSYMALWIDNDTRSITTTPNPVANLALLDSDGGSDFTAGLAQGRVTSNINCVADVLFHATVDTTDSGVHSFELRLNNTLRPWARAASQLEGGGKIQSFSFIDKLRLAPTDFVDVAAFGENSATITLQPMVLFVSYVPLGTIPPP